MDSGAFCRECDTVWSWSDCVVSECPKCGARLLAPMNAKAVQDELQRRIDTEPDENGRFGLGADS